MAKALAAGPLLAALLLLLATGAQAHSSSSTPAPPVAAGLLRFPACSSSTAEAACAASAAADLDARLARPQWDPAWRAATFEQARRGPPLARYPPVDASAVPAGCSPLAWAHARLLAAVDASLRMRLNYCHFHAPGYEAPPEVRRVCVQLEPAPAPCVWVPTAICGDEGAAEGRAPWRGLDCSNFVAWVYALAFGYAPATAVGEMACGPTRAPGLLLHDVRASDAHRLAPGDLLFGRLSRHHARASHDGAQPAPSAVRHVAMFTGLTADFSAGASGPLANASLLAAVPARLRPAVAACMASAHAAGRPVWVVADSAHAGPALRPWCVYGEAGFSHARRVIVGEADEAATRAAWPVRNSPAVAAFNATSGACISSWRLLTAGAGVQTHARHHHRPPAQPAPAPSRVVDESAQKR